MTTSKDIDELIKEYSGKTISELNHIIQNNHHYTNEQINVAKQVIGKKRMDWREKNFETSKKIDEVIRKEKWFDFHVLEFDGYRLTVGGSIDLTYYHKLEVIFEDIFFVSGFFRGWHSDTEKIVFQIPENEIELNGKYEIEQDYQLFTFKTEDFKNDIIIASNNISYNTDTVFYYNRPDLKPNERIADFVKKKNAL